MAARRPTRHPGPSVGWPEHGVDGLLQVAVGDVRVGVAREGHFTLLGQAQPAFEVPGGWPRMARLVGPPPRPMAPPRPWKRNSSTPAATQTSARRALGLVQLPVGGDEAAVLVAVRIAEHDLLALAPGGKLLGVDGQGVEIGHQVAHCGAGRRWSRRGARSGGCCAAARRPARAMNSPASLASRRGARTSLTPAVMEMM